MFHVEHFLILKINNISQKNKTKTKTQRLLIFLLISDIINI